MSATAPQILTRRAGHVAEIVFDNPARLNAMTLAMWQGLSDRLAEFAADREVRVVVLSGAGGRAFVSGADISEFGAERGTEADVARYNRVSEAAERAVAGFPKPILAAIEGYCLGGGVGIAIGCDLRLASESAAFGVPAGRLGLGYAYEGVARLIDTIGPSATAGLFLTGARIGAAEAQRIGLVNTVVPAEGFRAAVDELAAEIAENAPLTLQAFKAAMIEHRRDPAVRDPGRVAGLVRQCYASRDYAEGRAAFAERRKPVFRGE